MQNTNHILPFLWVHGEEEATYRHMVQVVKNANIHEICVEARPHKEFAKEGWWHDLGIILDEAQKQNMRVWILDDAHFPTGYAAGAALTADVSLRRQFFCHHAFPLSGGRTHRRGLQKYIKPPKVGLTDRGIERYYGSYDPDCRFQDDSLFSCVAVNGQGDVIDLMPHIQNLTLDWTAPDGNWTVEVVSLSRNTGYRRKYYNMLDTEACHLQIQAVYEPHYQHFGSLFGTVIAGFFSDEPELGNGSYFARDTVMGKEQSLPYSGELAALLERRLGQDWKRQIYRLWGTNRKDRESVRVRYCYMDCVTQLVSETFSGQIGRWCSDHGVDYIGHVIEDDNMHARTGSGLGHYFRGLKWQTMAGIDVVSGQVFQGGEGERKNSFMNLMKDGEFYHYALGKLGSSLGELSPRMKGRTMCEMFGNYGWASGVRQQKYILDHFLVRGVNYLVPHAFNCGAYPDKDCPPHFYAQGHNPQYRHFGDMMCYAEGVCKMLDGGKCAAKVGILYHAEAEWAGKAMLMQKPARILMDHQIDFLFVPGDSLTDTEFYQSSLTAPFCVNGHDFEVLIVPYAQYLPEKILDALARLKAAGQQLLFIYGLPDSAAEGTPIPPELQTAQVVDLDDLLKNIPNRIAQDVVIQPWSDRIRVRHYYGEKEVYFLVNESGDVWSGSVILPEGKRIYVYDPWTGQNHPACQTGNAVAITVKPNHSRMLVVGRTPDDAVAEISLTGEKTRLESFRISTCAALDYPNFGQTVPGKRFSGFIRYETEFDASAGKRIALEVTDAREGVEVFVNGESVGRQIAPYAEFDLTPQCRTGQNRLAIEVATTLEGDNKRFGKCAPVGITGEVNLYLE